MLTLTNVWPISEIPPAAWPGHLHTTSVGSRWGQSCPVCISTNTGRRAAPLLTFLGPIMKNNSHLDQKPSDHHKKKSFPCPANLTFRMHSGGRWVSSVPEHSSVYKLQVATRSFCSLNRKQSKLSEYKNESCFTKTFIFIPIKIWFPCMCAWSQRKFIFYCRLQPKKFNSRPLGRTRDRASPRLGFQSPVLGAKWRGCWSGSETWVPVSFWRSI